MVICVLARGFKNSILRWSRNVICQNPEDLKVHNTCAFCPIYHMLWSPLSFSVVILIAVDGDSDINASLHDCHPIPSASLILISSYKYRW